MMQGMKTNLGFEITEIELSFEPFLDASSVWYDGISPIKSRSSPARQCVFPSAPSSTSPSRRFRVYGLGFRL